MPTRKPKTVDQDSKSESKFDFLRDVPEFEVNTTLTSDTTPPKSTSKNTTNQTSTKPGVFGAIKEILSSDVIWISVALSLLVAVILFYFQVLQPLIFRKYIDSANNSISMMRTDFANQMNRFYTTVNSATPKVSLNNTAGICSEDQKYQNLEDLSQGLKEASLKIKPKTEYQAIPKYNVFYDRQIEQVYGEVYIAYSEKLEGLKPILVNLTTSIDFLSFKNTWIDTCGKFQKALTFKELIALCETQDKTNKEFLATHSKLSFSNNLEQLVQKHSQLCSASDEYSFGNFKFAWTDLYGELFESNMNLYNEFNQQAVIETSINDLDGKITKAQGEFERIRKERRTFSKMWYLLDF